MYAPNIVCKYQSSLKRLSGHKQSSLFHLNVRAKDESCYKIDFSEIKKMATRQFLMSGCSLEIFFLLIPYFFFLAEVNLITTLVFIAGIEAKQARFFVYGKSFLNSLLFEINVVSILSCRIFTHLATLFYVAMQQKIKSTNSCPTQPFSTLTIWS
jgi:hypothetical protein